MKVKNKALLNNLFDGSISKPFTKEKILNALEHFLSEG